MTRTIAEITAGKSIDALVDDYLGGDASSPKAGSDGTEHVASAADMEDDFSNVAPGFPGHLEKLADWCDGLVDQLEELPKTAALTGDLRYEFADELHAPPAVGKDPTIESMLDRVLRAGRKS